MSFTDKIKHGKLPQPTQPKFTVQSWEKEYKKVVNPSQKDIDVFHAGIWIFEKLETIRRNLSEIEIVTLRKDKLIRVFAGVVNRTSFILSKTHIGSPGTTIFAEQLIQGKYKKNVFGIDYTPDEILTGTIDGIRFPIRYALSKENKTDYNAVGGADIYQRAMYMIHLGNYYDDLEEIWLDVLWNDWTIQQNNDIDIVQPPSKYIGKVITDYRRDNLILQFTMFAVSGWKSMPDRMRREIGFRPKVIISGSGKSRRYQLGIDDKIEECSFTYVAKFLANEFYYTDAVNTPLPKYCNKTISDLLLVWEMLYSLAESLQNKFPENSGVENLGKIYQYSPGVGYKHLVSLVHDLLATDQVEAKKVLDIFVFSGNEEVWFRPLIKVDNDTIVPIIAPLLTGNILRLVEYWMRNGGFDMSKRGNFFEDHVRTEVAAFLKNNDIIKRAKIATKSGKLNSIDEEIDIVIQLGNKILVGEMKCGVFPISPIESYNYYCDLQYGAEQALRKSAAIKANCSNAFYELGFEPSKEEEIEIIPFIITNQASYAGLHVNSVPVVDLYLLQRYFQDGKYEPTAMFEPNGNFQIIREVRFYSTEAEAIDRIDGYLDDPPQLSILKSSITKRILPHFPLEGHKPCVLHAFEVLVPVPDM